MATNTVLGGGPNQGPSQTYFKIHPKDLGKAENLLRALRKATFNDMLGEEILAFSQCYKWFLDFLSESKPSAEKAKEKIESMKKELKDGKDNPSGS